MLYLHSEHFPLTISLECPENLSAIISSTVFSELMTTQPFHSTIKYQVTEIDKKYFLFRNKRLTHRNRTIEKIVYALEWQIVSDLIRQNKSILKFHAASLSVNGNGYLFIGDSGTGKTSLSISLLQNGWNFLSDEFGLLDPESFELLPFPRNLIIKPHHHKYFNSIPDNIQFTLKEHEGNHFPAIYMAPATFGKSDYSVLPKIHKIFLLENQTNSFDIQSISQSDAFNQLLTLLFNPYNFRKNLVKILAKLLRNIPINRLIMQNPLEFNSATQKMFIDQIVKC
jgi:hypothetical protein